MSRKIYAVLLPVVLLFLAGCGYFDWCHPRCTTTGARIHPGLPSGRWTAHQAYELARPAILSWHSDAVVILVSPDLYLEHPDWGLHPDGTAVGWRFEVVSPGAEVGTEITFWDGQIFMGLDAGCGPLEISASVSHPEKCLRMDQAIGSDQVLAIVMAQGIGLDGLRSFHLSTYEGLWYLDFEPQGGGPLQEVIIDARSGAVQHNDFASPAGAGGEQGSAGP